jgi:Flp pilus assembly pilin Flp
MTDLITYFRARFDREEGQTMAEYGVVLAVITVAAIAALGVLSGAIGSAIDAVSSRL